MFPRAEPLPPPSPPEASVPRTGADGRLIGPWSWILGAAWAAIGVGFVIVAATSRQVGKPVWWLGDTPIGPSVWWLVPAIGPIIAVGWSTSRARRALTASTVATVLSGAIAVGDLSRSPGAAVFELALAVAGALVTAAALAGRPPHSRVPTSRGVPTRREARLRR